MPPPVPLHLLPSPPLLLLVYEEPPSVLPSPPPPLHPLPMHPLRVVGERGSGGKCLAQDSLARLAEVGTVDALEHAAGALKVLQQEETV